MILIVDCGSSKVPFIENYVDEFIDYQTRSVLEIKKEDLGSFIGIIISGAPLLITEMDIQPYINQTKLLIESGKPILGICFGHQLLGLSFGAFGSRMREDREQQTIEIFEESILFEKLPSEISMMEDHCETISIPQGFQLVASSDVCVNEAMQHSEKPLFGVQFHPEISGNHGRIIFENFIRFCQKSDSR